MADTFGLAVATRERLYVHEPVEEAQIPSTNGYLGVLPGHAALVSELGSGELTYTSEARHRSLRIEGGWLEVHDNRVRVLATTAEAPEE
jgi:F-type H+-transporting ATPase subunit epsilon